MNIRPILISFFVAFFCFSGHADPGEKNKKEPVKVELNSASVDELCLLPGIGPKKAEAIIALRDRYAFTRVTQLLRVRGIGRKTLERLRAYIYIEPLTKPSKKNNARLRIVDG